MNPPSQREVEKLLSECPSVRKPPSLERIYDFLSTHTEVREDPLWNFLGERQRAALCRFVRLHRVYDDDGESYTLFDPRSTRSTGGKLAALLRGEVRISRGGYSAQLKGGGGCGSRGTVFGSLHMPRNLRAFVTGGRTTTTGGTGGGSGGDDPEEEEEERGGNGGGLFHQFAAALRRKGLSLDGALVHVKKGSTYVAIYDRDVRPFVSELCDRLSSLSVLESLGLGCLRDRYKLKTFPRGRIVIREGEAETGHVFLLVKGSCLLFREGLEEGDDGDDDSSGTCEGRRVDGSQIDAHPHEPPDENCIGSVGSTSFLGFIPHFSSSSPRRRQPITAVASSLGGARMLVFGASEFVEGVKSVDGMGRAFAYIAERQVEWLRTSLPLMVKAQRSSCGAEDRSQAGADVEEEGLVSAAAAPPLEEHPIMKSSLDIDTIMNSRIPKNPKLNRHKVLSEFGRLVRDEEKVVELMEYEEPLDPFGGFDFIDAAGYAAMEEPIELEWFPPVEAPPAFDRVRPLSPFPSILLSRKMYGKTLPAVRQSRGFANPFT